MTTSRSDFNQTWLFEAPEKIGHTELIDMLEYTIRDMIKNGQAVQDLGNGYKKIEGVQILLYWYEVDGKIQLVVELSKRPQALVINAVGKRNRGAKPFASDLYDLILQDRKNTPGSVNSIRIMSDTQLSDEGFKVYPRMLAQGHKISVYDRENPGQSFTEINFPEELEKYIKFDDTSFRRYQFVISESGAPYAETRSFFNTRRYRELAGLGLDD